MASAACYRETGRRVRGSKDHQGPHWPGEESELHSKGCGKPRDGFKVGGWPEFLESCPWLLMWSQVGRRTRVDKETHRRMLL